MAKKIKFALVMKQGKEEYQVRDLQSMREHFDLASVIGYLHDGKLVQWLEARYLDAWADKVRGLQADDEDIGKKLCEIFEVVYDEAGLDVAEIAVQQERLAKLKQITADEDVFAHAEWVAFNQEELMALLDEGQQIIYLCQNHFNIPLNKEGITYIGVGKAEAEIRSTEVVDLQKKNIVFRNIDIDKVYDELVQGTEDKVVGRVSK